MSTVQADVVSLTPRCQLHRSEQTMADLTSLITDADRAHDGDLGGQSRVNYRHRDNSVSLESKEHGSDIHLYVIERTSARPSSQAQDSGLCESGADGQAEDMLMSNRQLCYPNKDRSK